MTACPRCDRFHERQCDICEFEPACHDHNCWSTANLIDALEESLRNAPELLEDELGCPPGCQSPFCACPGTD